MDFSDIVDEYYTLFRGQNTTLTTTDPEFAIAIMLGNNAIKKWERADGQLWRELVLTLQNDAAETPPIPKVVTGGTTTYVCPTNLRMPPSKVRFYNGSSSDDIIVKQPQSVMNYTDDSTFVWFEGGANRGFIMHISLAYSNLRNGWSFDYPYVKKADQVPTNDANAAAEFVPEMSDPNFMIQDMLASRFSNARNGFGFKVAKADAQTSLANMKIEDTPNKFEDTMRDFLNGENWGSLINGTSGLDMRL